MMYYPVARACEQERKMEQSRSENLIPKWSRSGERDE